MPVIQGGVSGGGTGPVAAPGSLLSEAQILLRAAWGPTASASNLKFVSKTADNTFFYTVQVTWTSPSGRRSQTVNLQRGPEGKFAFGRNDGRKGVQDPMVVEGGFTFPAGSTFFHPDGSSEVLTEPRTVGQEIFDSKTAFLLMQPLIDYLNSAMAGGPLTEAGLIPAINEAFRNLGKAGADSSWRHFYLTQVFAQYNQLLEAAQSSVRLGGIAPIQLPIGDPEFGAADPSAGWVPGAAGLIQVNGARVDEAVAQTEGLPDTFAGFGGGGTGGGGGGGTGGARGPALGPTYVIPDRRVVADSIRSKLKLVVGRAGERRVEFLTDLYMSAHFANFNDPTRIVDPMQSVLERIRIYPDYQAIHNLRPTDVDEDDWLTSAIAGFRRQGIDFGAKERGVNAAVTGDITVDAGFIKKATQIHIPEFFNKASQVSSIIGGAVK